jgi:hypothetical protein
VLPHLYTHGAHDLSDGGKKMKKMIGYGIAALVTYKLMMWIFGTAFAVAARGGIIQ